MSKRFSYQPKGQVNKKPKLDISINNRFFGGTSKPKPPTTHPAPEPANEDIWGDEDDEVILLASQACETIEKYSQQIFINQESFSDLSFREIPTSTQVTMKPTNDVIDLLQDDDDDAFDNIDKVFQNDHEIQMLEAKGVDNFKIPRPIKNSLLPPPPLPTKSWEQPGSSNKNDQKDIQLKYLMNKVETYKKEIDKLSKDASEFNDKIQTKDGEVTMLRYELRHLKQQHEHLRLEKLQENDIVKKEWQDKIKELEKQIRAQQNELEFKNVEMVNIKSKRLNESQRYFDTIEIKKDFSTVQYLHHLHLGIQGIHVHHKKLEIPIEMFEKSSGLDQNSNFRDSLFERELENIQSLLSQINITKTELPANDDVSQRIIDSTKITISELYNYVQGLEFTKYNDTNANVEYKFLCQKRDQIQSCDVHKKRKETVYQQDDLYLMEKAQTARRIIAGLALACRHSIYESLTTERIENNSIIEIIIEAIHLIGYSKELYSHFGMLESFGTLLYSIIRKASENQNMTDPISRYLVSLIFCRPDIRPLVEISNCLNFISSNYNNPSILNSLCSNSAVGTFIINEYYKIFQFSPESCTLQVYGALLEVALPQGEILKQSQIDCLSRLCHNHIRFLRNCFERKIHWTIKSKNNSGTCDCYIKIVNSFTVLFHLFLKQWIDNPKSIDRKTVTNISQIGSMLLCDIFHVNFRRGVLQNGGSSIKNRLKIIHNWLSKYKDVFRFKTAHCNALQSIKLSHIIADPIRNTDEQLSEDSSYEGRKIWSNIFENSI